jgi:DNA-binding MarR family transcriptional regulator
MAKMGISDNEKMTLVGLVKYPTLNDRQLSEQIGIKMSTVTAIKNRLKDQGYFITVRVPKLQLLGAELLSVCYAHTNPSFPEERALEIGRKLFEGFEELFYIGAGPRYRFCMAMHSNYSRANLTFNEMFRLYSEYDFMVPEKPKVVLFPFGQSKILNFFDYSSVLERAFGISLPDRPVEESLGKKELVPSSRVEMSRIELKVLRGLIDNPDLLDSNIAKRIDVTRQSVTKMRKKFQDNDMFFTIRIPNLGLLGFEILAFIHTEYLPNNTMKERSKLFTDIYSETPVIMKIEGDLDGVEIVATENYPAFSDYYNAMATRLRERNYISKDPTVLLFTFDELVSIKNHVYTPALSRVTEPEG